MERGTRWNLPQPPTALPPAAVLHSWLLKKGGSLPLIWDCLLKQMQCGGIVLWKLGLGHFTKCLQTFRHIKLPTVNAEPLSLLRLISPESSLGGWVGVGGEVTGVGPGESLSWGSGLGNCAAVCLNNLSVIGIV